MMQALPDSTKYRLVRKGLGPSGQAPARLPVRRKEGQHMKCANESIRECGDGRWQAHFYYRNGDRWKVDPRSFEATSKRAARRRVDEIKEGLERAAQAEGSEGRASLSEEDMTTEGFLRRLVDGLVSFGQMERTTANGYRASAEPASGAPRGQEGRRAHRRDDPRLAGQASASMWVETSAFARGRCSGNSGRRAACPRRCRPHRRRPECRGKVKISHILCKGPYLVHNYTTSCMD